MGIDWCIVSGALLAVLVACEFYRLKQRRTKDDDEWQRREQRSLQDLLRRLQTNTGGRTNTQTTHPRGEQSGKSESELAFYARRDGRQRYAVDSLQDHPRHPDGSALAAWARKIRPETKRK
jgi:hypothetical protein